MLSKIIKFLILVITVVVVGYYGMFYFQEADKYLNYRSSGVVQSSLSGPDSNLVFTRVDTADFISRPYPNIGDRLLMISDTAVTSENLTKYFNSPNPPGAEIGITYLSNQDTLKTEVRTRPPSSSQLAAQTILMFMRFLISICYLAVGIWAFVKRPDSGAVQALVLFSFAMGCFMMTAVTMVGANYASNRIPILDTLAKIISGLVLYFGAFWLNLQLLFPSTRPIVKKHPIIIYSLCYLPLTILGFILIITKIQALGYPLIAIPIIQTAIGFIILGRFYGRTKEPLEKRQTRLVLWGSGIGLGVFGLFIVLVVVASSMILKMPEYYLIAALMIVFLGLLLSPLSFAYAFGKYRLLEIEGRIRRGTQQLLIGAALLIMFYLVVYFVSNFTLDILRIESRSPILISALILAIGFAPAQRRLLGVLNKRIYPERFRLKSMLDEFLSQSLNTSDKKVYWDGLENRLKTALKVDTIYPVIRTADKDQFRLRDNSATPFEPGSDFIGRITAMGGRPIMRDELEADKKGIFTESETDWLTNHNIALILPLITHSELIGFLCVGLKSEQQDFETADFEILKSLAIQIAISADNVLLLEENVEKKRMEAELSIARKVQEKMLPQNIPETPGFEIAATSRFCTEVAGDYYDVIDAADGRTILAIGDVSGKGAAAALLMSNVQASLRTAVGIESRATSNSGIRLADIVVNINRLIYQNSQPEQFITFFVALFDSKSKKLDYINAGHNPPLIVNRAGQIIELTEGGILLGIMPEMPYKLGSVQLNEGDILFLYTDGLSESTRADDEMFGEDRIKQFLIANNSLVPQALLEKLEQDVSDFIGDQHLGDDFTLIIAKVK
jgi:sigma-B regulation protein RsbU (phosphoserine phosphatase)